MSLTPPSSDIFEVRAGETGRETCWFLPECGFLNAKCLRFFDMDTSKFAFVLPHPVAEKVELYRCSWDLPTKIPPEHGFTAVRTLVLVDSYIGFLGFEQILQSLPCLRKLQYYRPYDERDNDFDMVGRAICMLGTNLEHLTMLNGSLMPFCSEVGSLASLHKLKTLEIELEFLIGFRDIPREGYEEYEGFPCDEDDDDDEPLNYDEIHESFGDWSFLDLLPTSLEKLKISIEHPKIFTYYNTYERYGAKFEELISADCQFDRLNYVQAPYIYHVAERLQGRLTRWVYAASDIMTRVPATELLTGAATSVTAGSSGGWSSD